MDISEEPELDMCLVCKKIFWSPPYSGGSDVCPECFAKECELYDNRSLKKDYGKAVAWTR